MNTPHLITRPGTIDADVVRCVIEANEYRLPERMDGWTVVDVGAHIGSFAVACMMRGAARVLCFEPDRANAELCGMNIEAFLTANFESDLPPPVQFEVFRLAVWMNTFGAVALTDAPNYESDGELKSNTGGRSVICDVCANATALSVTLDQILSLCDKVDLLKLDCEGSEWRILSEARGLDDVHCICGEYHSIGDPAYTPSMAVLLDPEFSAVEVTPATPNGFFWGGKEKWWK